VGEESAEDRDLYVRCPACEGGPDRHDCEGCGGIGFIPIGLTMEGLYRVAFRVAELCRSGESLYRTAREIRDRRCRDPRPNGT
jgi:hypothetical protein